MPNLIQVNVIGHATRDAELKQAGTTELAAFGVAANFRAKDESGSWVSKPMFFDVAFFGRRAEYVAEVRKGDPVCVVGSLEQREWKAKDGTMKTNLSIVATAVEKLGGRGERPAAESRPAPVADDEMPF